MFRLPRVTLLLLTLAVGPARADEFRDLFNGRDLDGWVVDGPREFKDASGQMQPIWTVKDGMIACQGKGFGFLRYDRQQFGDFRWHVEYRLAPKGNSGLGIRTRVFDPKDSRGTRPSFYSYEIQIFDDAGKKPDRHSTGSLYRYVAPKSNPGKPAGEWNAFDVECVGPRIKIWLNGELIQDVDQSAIPEIRNKPLKGYVCVQNHGSKVEFRNLKIREIKSAGAR